MPRLTVESVRKEKPAAARREVADSVCPGLYLIVQPSGVKSWAARYRFLGKPRKLTLGAYDPNADDVESAGEVAVTESTKLGLIAAREKCRAALRMLDKGRDPAGEKIAARERQAVEDERKERGEVIKASDTFAVAWARFDADHIATALKPGTAKKWRAIYTNVFKPRWENRPLESIEPVDVAGMVSALRGTPHAADTARMVARVFFKWASSGSNRILASNPAADVEKAKRGKEVAKANNDRTLSDQELRWVWKAAGNINPVFGGIVRLLILTGQRRDEVAAMPKTELNTAARRWTLAGTRSKNGKAHTIHLSDEALAVLADVPQVGTEGAFQFSTDGVKALSGYSKFKDLLDAAVAKVAAEECGEPVTVEPWKLHDLRRSFASGCARLGVSLQVVERMLNHSSGSLGGLVAVYNKHGYEAEQVAAWDRWSRHVAAVVSDAPSNVVPLVPQQGETVPA